MSSAAVLIGALRVNYKFQDLLESIVSISINKFSLCVYKCEKKEVLPK